MYCGAFSKFFLIQYMLCSNTWFTLLMCRRIFNLGQLQVFKFMFPMDSLQVLSYVQRNTRLNCCTFSMYHLMLYSDRATCIFWSKQTKLSYLCYHRRICIFYVELFIYLHQAELCGVLDNFLYACNFYIEIFKFQLSCLISSFFNIVHCYGLEIFIFEFQWCDI